MSGFIAKTLFSAPEKFTKIENRRFSCPNLVIKDHLEKIGTTFLFGYNNTLLNQKKAFLSKKLTEAELEYRGFAYEGVGMGLALLDNLPFNDRNRLSRFIEGNGNQHKYMLHVGAGWAVGKFPVNIERVIQKHDPLLRWLIVDGYGFHQAYFHTKKYVYNASIPEHLSPFTRHVFYQGVGRALWFVEGAQPGRIASRIKTFPKEFHSDLWSGTGLASTYAGGVGKEEISALIKLGQTYILDLAQGACFAAKAREHAGNPTSHTEMACQLICGLSSADAARVTDECSLVLPLNNSEIAYGLWRSKIKYVVKNYKYNHLEE